MIEIKLWEIKRRTLCRAERNSVYCNIIIIILPHGLPNGSASDLCQAKNNQEQRNIVITLTVGDREGFYKSNKGISSFFATGLTSLSNFCLLLIQFCTLYPKFIAPGIVL